MPNMHYCRFQNTLQDLQHCAEALDDDETLSPVEEQACRALVALCVQIAANYGARTELASHIVEMDDDYY